MDYFIVPQWKLIHSGPLGTMNGPECNKKMHHGTNAIGAAGLSNSLTGSKYFKAAHQLLDEVMNVGKGIKSESVNHKKYQTWFGTISNKKNIATEATLNDPTTSAITRPSISAQEMKNEHAFGLTPADRQEIQMKMENLVRAHFSPLSLVKFLEFEKIYYTIPIVQAIHSHKFLFTH